METQVKYFKNLDGLRFLCFLSVFTVHTLHTSDKRIEANIFHKLLVDGLLGNGAIAVNFFFVLSGFLITYLLINEKKATGTIKILPFWFKRVIRIWPLYFGCIVFSLIIFPYVKRLFGETFTNGADAKLYLLFLGNFDIIKNGWPDSTELGVLWSVSIEEQFYLLWPLFLYLLNISKYWMAFLAIIMISLLFRGLHDDKVIYNFHTFSCMSDMALGGLGAWLMEFASCKKAIENLSRFKIILVYVAFFVVFVFRDQLLNGFYITRVFERLIISIPVIFIILEQNFSLNSFYKMGNLKRLSKLGLVTYGMYMLHIIAYLIIVILLKKLKVADNVYCIAIIGPLLALGLTILMSKISYRYFETPFLKLRKLIKN